ncbi:hypothetical protein ABIB35_003327 [Arthrobacter sp. UYP6]|uniref:hypothetical protein n=1 Tax=Arthrobacter sp. UYP6 TaxID=1756378 RepID=UPI00339B4145
MTEKNLAPELVEDEEVADVQQRQEKQRRGNSWALLLTSAVLLCGAGGLAGAVLVDPTGSEEYAALESSEESIASDLAETTSDYEALQDDYDVMAGGIRKRETGVEKREAAVAASEEKVKSSEAAVKAREDAVTGAEKTKAANTVGDGTWVVGTDIAPGNYRTAQPVGSSCYWGIHRSGSNGSDIVDNDLPGGGHPVVTLAEGQDFKSSRCGTWEKQ